MYFTLLQSSTAHLLGIIDSYKSGRSNLDDLISQLRSGIRQLEYILHTSKNFLLTLEASQHYPPVDGWPIYTSTLAFAHSYRIILLDVERRRIRKGNP
jgi:hypothetical protein